MCSLVLTTCVETIPRSAGAASLRDFTCSPGNPPFSILSTEYLNVPINSCLVSVFPLIKIKYGFY